MTQLYMFVSALLCLAAGLHTDNDPLQINFRLLDSAINNIQWINDDIVFLLTEKNQVYRSVNGGVDWSSQAHLMPHHASGGKPTDPINIKAMAFSPADDKVVFFLGLNGENWITQDMGDTYQPAGELKLTDVRMHPTKPAFILGTSFTQACTDKSAPGDCYKVLQVTKDFGATWKSILKYVVQFDWASPGRAPHEHTIFVTAHNSESNTGTQHFGVWDKTIDFMSSDTFFSSSKTLVPHGNRFLFGDFGYLFVAAVKPDHAGEVTLQVASGNSSLQFHTAQLPVELSEHSYTILDASEGTVFLHVNHAALSEKAQEGMVYISDGTGVHYSKSLPYNHRNSGGSADFEKINGMEGIYIANFVDAEDPELIDVESEESMFDGRNKYQDAPTHVKTVITFDKGAEWRFIPPPPKDSNGNPWECSSKHCHLHLHGITDTQGPVYSTTSATGLIMATGLVANYLHQHDIVNTFFSRDAGLTWREIAKGSHIYEFADRGGLVVMAKDTEKTKELLYSWDEGLTWGFLQMSDEPFMVDNIITQKQALSQEFLVYGYTEGHGVVVHVNFENLHERECTGHQDPSAPNSDYEYWSPSDGRLNGKCLLGHTTSYLRRKQASQCYNPDPFDRLVEMEHCQCVIDDFECEYGFERVEGEDASGDFVEGSCQLIFNDEKKADPYSHDCASGRETRRVTQGYRRVPFDTCLNGEEWDPVEIACPSSLHMSKLILVLLLLVAGSTLVVFLGNQFNLPCKLGFASDYALLGGRPGRTIDTPDDVFYLDDDDAATSNAHILDDGPSMGSLPVISSSGAGSVPRLSGPTSTPL